MIETKWYCPDILLSVTSYLTSEVRNMSTWEGITQNIDIKNRRSVIIVNSILLFSFQLNNLEYKY